MFPSPSGQPPLEYEREKYSSSYASSGDENIRASVFCMLSFMQLRCPPLHEAAVRDTDGIPR